MLTDSAVKSRVKIELSVRDLLDGDDVKINVADGKVTLMGRVKSKTSANKIARTCWTVDGVTGVDNQLKTA